MSALWCTWGRKVEDTRVSAFSLHYSEAMVLNGVSTPWHSFHRYYVLSSRLPSIYFHTVFSCLVDLYGTNLKSTLQTQGHWAPGGRRWESASICPSWSWHLHGSSGVLPGFYEFGNHISHQIISGVLQNLLTDTSLQHAKWN